MTKPYLFRTVIAVSAIGMVVLVLGYFLVINAPMTYSVAAGNDSESRQSEQDLYYEPPLQRIADDRRLPQTTSETGSTLHSSDENLLEKNIEALHEIASRISDQQFSEGQNELDALIRLIDPKTDNDKISLLQDFLTYSQNNVFNPEVVTAFNTLWNSLSMDNATRIEAAKLLAHHYSDTYEFTFVLEQISTLVESGVPLDASLLRDLSYAQFSLGDYVNAIPNLLDHISSQTAQGDLVDRREYSMLFESYYRTGDYDSAEMIGTLLLDHYNDEQDWRDMQQFYQSIKNLTGAQ